MIQGPAWLILLSSGETSTNPPLLFFNSPYVQIGSSFKLVPSFFILLFHVSAAESIPEGMQSGQLLQTGAPAAGEGTGEQQLHHRAQTEGFLRRGRCHRCGECLYVCVCVRKRQKERGLSCPDFTDCYSSVLILLQYFHIFCQFGSSVSWALNLLNAVRCI